MTEHGGWWWAVPRVGGRLFWLLLVGLISCSSDGSGGASGAGPLVRLHPSPVDSAATSADLTVKATDPAGQVKSFPMKFSSGPFDLMGVTFPPGTRGATDYVVNLYGAASCVIATGTASLNLDSDGTFELTVAMTAVPLCGNSATLTVQVANVSGGVGSVTSLPAGINCQGAAAGCSAMFPKGQQVTLTAHATSGAFAGWSSSGCSGTGDCALTLTQDAQIQAVFTACHGWCQEPLGFNVSANLNGISGTEANNVLVVGDAGTALLWNGTMWQKLPPPGSSGVTLRAAYGKTGGSVINVAGDGGLAWQFSGGNWSALTNASTMNLRAIASGIGANTFFVGDGGTALVLGGTTLTSKNPGTTSNIYALAQNPSTNKDDLLIGGAVTGAQGLARLWDGNGGSSGQMTNPGANIAGNINAVHCGPALYFAVGDGGAIVKRTNNGNAGSWASVTSPTNVALRGMWSTSDTNITAVGDSGTIIQYDGSTWTKVPGVSTTSNLRAVWGSSAMNIYAVGDGGTILHYLP